MKIKRFNEDEQVDISSERVSEINEELKDFASIMLDKSKYIEVPLIKAKINRNILFLIKAPNNQMLLNHRLL